MLLYNGDEIAIVPIRRLRLKPAMRWMCIISCRAHFDGEDDFQLKPVDSAVCATAHFCPVPVIYDQHELRVECGKSPGESIVLIGSAMRPVVQVDVERPVIRKAECTEIALDHGNFRSGFEPLQVFEKP